jgi:hypothetical protein
MGLKNHNLIVQHSQAKRDGDTEKMKIWAELIDKSQEECPHPISAQSMIRHKGRRYTLCKWCSKQLKDLGSVQISADKEKASNKPGQKPVPVSDKAELVDLAKELDDEWQCSGGLRHWNELEKHSFISRASDLADMVLRYFAKEDL